MYRNLFIFNIFYKNIFDNNSKKKFGGSPYFRIPLIKILATPLSDRTLVSININCTHSYMDVCVIICRSMKQNYSIKLIEYNIYKILTSSLTQLCDACHMWTERLPYIILYIYIYNIHV